jgi:hypothetical protein
MAACEKRPTIDELTEYVKCLIAELGNDDTGEKQVICYERLLSEKLNCQHIIDALNENPRWINLKKHKQYNSLIFGLGVKVQVSPIVKEIGDIDSVLILIQNMREIICFPLMQFENKKQAIFKRIEQSVSTSVLNFAAIKQLDDAFEKNYQNEYQHVRDHALQEYLSTHEMTIENVAHITEHVYNVVYSTCIQAGMDDEIAHKHARLEAREAMKCCLAKL